MKNLNLTLKIAVFVLVVTSNASHAATQGSDAFNALSKTIKTTASGIVKAPYSAARVAACAGVLYRLAVNTKAGNISHSAQFVLEPVCQGLVDGIWAYALVACAQYIFS